MRYYKIIEDGRIACIGTGLDGEDITEQEYADIYAAIQSRPEPPDGYNYRLKESMEWELIELPVFEEAVEDGE